MTPCLRPQQAQDVLGELRADACQMSLWQSLRKVFSFELPLKQPWLDQFGPREHELVQLERNLEDRSHKLATRLMDSLMRWSSVRLCRQREPSDYLEDGKVWFPNTALEFSASCAPRDELDGTQASCAPKRTRLSVLPFLATSATIVYCSAFIYTTAYLLLQHDVQATRMQPEVRHPNASTVTPSGAHCALKSQIEFGPRYDERRFRQINEWLDLLGVTVRSQLGVSFQALTIIGSTPLLFYCLPVVFVMLRGRELRLDAIAWLYEPAIEWRRLMDDERSILLEMLHSFETSCHECERFARRPNDFRWRLQHQHQHQHQLLRRSFRDAPKREFIGMVAELMRDRSQLRPLVANSEWHLLRQKFFHFIIVIFLAISQGGPISALLYANMMELKLRVEERLRALECLRWHPEGVLLRPSLRLLPISADDTRLYELYDGSLAHFCFLMLRVELRYFGNPLSLLHYALTLLPILFLLSVWSTFWATVYVLGFLDKISWLLQIKRQLEWCNELARAGHARQPGAARKRSRPASNERQLAAERRRHFLKRLLRVFINYELYRRQHKPFRILSNFLLLQAAMFTGAVSVMLYLVVVNIETQFKVNIFVSSACVTGSLNLYLVLASYTSKLVENIQLELIRLLATLGQDSQLSAAPALDIWRRQLLSEPEVELFASTGVLGLSASYKRIVGLNVRIIGIWLIMWRAFGPSPSVL